MRYWPRERLDQLTLDRLATRRARALRLRLHHRQLHEPHFSAALAEFDAYVAARSHPEGLHV